MAVSEVVYAVRDGKALWAGRTLREWVPDLVDAVVTRFDPAKVILFGSVADGTDGPDSDIDLLVVLDVAPLEQRRQLMVELRRTTHGVAAPHDLLVTSVEDFERRRHQPGTTEYEPARGVVVHERHAA
jgi:predicted nucleotidyltransferase